MNLKRILKEQNIKLFDIKLNRISLYPFYIIHKYENNFIWRDLSKLNNLTENFIREFHDYVHWNYICMNSILSEDFIDEHKDKVIWKYIAEFQYLSEDFIRKNKSLYDNAAIWEFFMNKRVSNKFRREIRTWNFSYAEDDWYINF